MKRILLIVILFLSACNNDIAAPKKENPNDIYQRLTTTDPNHIDSQNSDEEVLPKKFTRVMLLTSDNVRPEALVYEYGGTVEQGYDELNMAAASVPVDRLDAIKGDKRVLHLENDKVVEVKPAQVVEWPNQTTQATRALESNFTGKGVKIAVIDSGISDHDDLQIAGGVSMVDYTSSYADDNGHGTHVAGIIGAENNDIGIVGIAPDAEIYAVKVLDEEGLGFTSDVIAGIDWAIQNKMDVINLSLGSETPSKLMESIINQAFNQNIVVIAASGNSGTETGIENNVNYPARYPSVIAVGATNKNNVRAIFSSTGQEVELAAPGVEIISTYLYNSYARMNGTSSAAPFVTGVVALIKQANPSLTVSQIRSKLQKDSIDLGDLGRDSWYGYGLVQAPIHFIDLAGHWAKNEILTVYDKQWMVGSNGYFRPQEHLTRAQAAVILVNILGLEDNNVPPKSFVDVSSDHWAAEQIKLVSQHGIMVGSENSFMPNRSLTREQMVSMLYQVFDTSYEETSNPFEDVTENRWSFPQIMAMYSLGVIRGVSPKEFDPASPITRAQMAVMLLKAEPYF